MATKIHVINSRKYKDLTTGKEYETCSRPTEPAPDGTWGSAKYAWHDVLCKWIPAEDIDKEFDMEIGEGAEGADADADDADKGE